MYKKNRSLTVIFTNDEKYNHIPTIHLKGKWLNDLGFEIGDKVNVECKDGRLIITKTCNEDALEKGSKKESVI